jgi:D-alanyl-D-alanine carboxypeptidase
LQNVVNEFTGRTPAASVAVAIPGEGRWAVSQGVARTEPKTPLPPNARFQVASTTKTFTAVAILQLEAERKLQIAQPVQHWFHDVPNAKHTTFDHLLRHTSGLVSYNALPSWTLDYRQPREAIALAAARPPQFSPGANFAYSNTGYAMLGVIIEDLVRRPLSDVFSERISRPLGLENTALRSLNDGMPVASGHVGGKPVEVADNYATPFAAGGLASTAEDLVTFWHALLSGRLVSPATVRAMFTDLAPMDQGGQMFYGRGVQLYDIPQGPGLMLGHSGGITGFTSIVAYVADDDLFVSVIFNDQKTPAEAGLWAVVRAVRAARQTGRSK